MVSRQINDLNTLIGTGPLADLHFTKQIAVAVAATDDFSACRQIVDVGGGNGALLVGILKANAALKGTLFDLPQVAQRARQHLRDEGLADRCEAIGGDFFAKCRVAPMPIFSRMSFMIGATSEPLLS